MSAQVNSGGRGARDNPSVGGTFEGMSEHPKVIEFRAMTDPVERAAACQAFIETGRAAVTAAESLRNDSIRAARAGGGTTVDGLAAKIGVKRNVVIEALRPGR